MEEVIVGNGRIGGDNPIYLIAEVGTTHLGDLDKALALVDMAAASGVDAVKFQMIDPDQDSDSSVEYAFESLGQSYSANMAKMFEQLHFEEEAWRTIAERARQNDIAFFATVDYFDAVKLSLDLGVPALKVGAWDSTYVPLIEQVAQTGLPTFVDLGPTSAEEVKTYVEIHSAAGGGPLLFFHDYHTSDAAQFNLRAIEALREDMTFPVGYSSPGRDDDIDFVAIGLGADFLEKRLILSRADHAYHADQSMEPEELAAWVKRIRRAHSALGRKAIVPSDTDLADAAKYYRSACTLTDIRAGDILSIENVAGKRPGTGLPTSRLSEIWGRRAARDLPVNTLLGWGDIA